MLDIDFEFIKLSLGYFILAGMTIVIALAWNNAFDSLIETYFPNKNTTVIGLFTYALTITLLSMIVLVNLVGKDKFSEIVMKNYSGVRRAPV